MHLTISTRPDPTSDLARLEAVLASTPNRLIACSGGVDSLLLATVAHRADPERTWVAHTVTPAVPSAGTSRVITYAEREGWHLELVRSKEFEDERYLQNPTDRCYYCKSNLYEALADIDPGRSSGSGHLRPAILSGANMDDLGEYRPGLRAAEERRVRHPFIEAEITKSQIRAMARMLGLDAAELPASPCLASRIYTGTRVTPPRLRAIEAGEQAVRAATGISVVRCRLRDSTALIEVNADDRHLIDSAVVALTRNAMTAAEPSLTKVELDESDYAPGRAFVGAPTT